MLRLVVVGLDGSQESLTAAEWAAREAARRGLPLRLIHACAGLDPDPPELSGPAAERCRVRPVLRDAADRLTARYPRVPLSVEQVSEPAAEALVSAAAEAELLVLGSRAFTGLGGLIAGSVAMAAVAHAPRPVALVRADHVVENEYLPDAAGRPSAETACRAVVLGLDPAHPSGELISFAFESAALRAAPLRVVYAWQLPFVQHAAQTRARRAMGAAAQRTLAAKLAPWREKFPGVEIDESAQEGSAAARLTHAAQDAGLLVVGRRIRPSRIGTHIGPVVHAAIHQVRCPVVIVPHE
ncbi:universal stress protein [Streptomyces sp. NPDC023723]|uniref:universal stress protein n=1 Tax=Streptomyces sp. NPDC023723 TaxID=3154323 RepID=UPI00340ECB2D